MRNVFESWSDNLFFRAWVESGQITEEALNLWFWDQLRDELRVALAFLVDTRNGKPIRLRRDAQSLAGARRVTRALRRAKPGKLVRL